MVNETARRWVDLAAESEKVAQIAYENERYRNSVSRAYYAFYQAATALMVHLELPAPARGNWSHARLATLLEGTAARKILRHRAIVFKQACTWCLFARASADYRPYDVVGAGDARETRRWAGMMMQAACGAIGYDPR